MRGDSIRGACMRGDSVRGVSLCGVSLCRTIGGLMRRGSLRRSWFTCGLSMRDGGTREESPLGASVWREGVARSEPPGAAPMGVRAGRSELPFGSNRRQFPLSDGAPGRETDGAGLEEAGVSADRGVLRSGVPPKRRHSGVDPRSWTAVLGASPTRRQPESSAPPAAGACAEVPCPLTGISPRTEVPCPLAGVSPRAAGAWPIPRAAPTPSAGLAPCSPNVRRLTCSMPRRCSSNGTRSI